MGKEGKVDVLSVLIVSIVIFVIYSVLVMGSHMGKMEFPTNNTNASATVGFGDSTFPSMSGFNGTNGMFKCNVSSLNTTTRNVTNVSLFINSSAVLNSFDVSNTTSVRNQTINTTTIGSSTVIFNVTTSFNEGSYGWWCESEDNSSTITYNESDVSFFTIDKTPPAFTSLRNTSNTALATEDTIYFSVNASDRFTVIKGVRLFVNISGTADNEVNTTGGTSGVTASNGTAVNLSYKIPGNQIGQVLNFTFQINDSVNNINITPAIIYLVESDGTVPGPINLSNPINLFNTSSTTVDFNFSAVDNNDTAFTCDINISSGGAVSESIAGLNVTSGVHHLNTSSALSNGTYSWSVNCTDGAGNINTSLSRDFTVDTGTPTISLSSLENGLSAVNQSNVTANTGINFTAVDSGAGVMKTFSWTSSCNASTQTISSSNSDFTAANLTFIYPFQNISSCANTEANQTVTITVGDYSGNTQSAHYQFAVDDKGPTITFHTPTGGQTVSDITEVNVSVFDSMSRVDTIGYYDVEKSLTTILNHTLHNGTDILTSAQGQNTSIMSRSINFTPGTHRIKITVNDTFGNVRNSSVITFTQTGPILFSDINTSLESYIGKVFNTNLTNVSIRIKTGAGTYADITVANETSTNTFEILYQVNGSINVSLTEINGSAPNWDKINFTPIINDTRTAAGIQNNWTNTILGSVVFNNSIEEFITNNNSYHGIVVLPFILNVSNSSKSTAQEFWWIKDGNTLTTRENISQCTGGFTRTDTTPCWNYTIGERTLIQVPHFSAVLAVNDSTAPAITVNTPSSSIGNHTVSMFKPNITVSSDTRSCIYQVNGSSPVSMTKTGTACIGQTERFKNRNGGWNITFNATDNSGNVASFGFRLNISDNTAPDKGLIAASSVGTTTAVITITGANESVNATVWYGTSITSLTSSVTETDFNITQTLSLSDLTANTKYYFNVTLRDFNGNVNRNGTYNFVTDVAVAAAAAEAAAGGGGAAATVSQVADSKAQLWNTIPAGSSISLDIDKATIAVTSVVVNDVKSELKNVDLEVASLKENPVSTDAAALVYQYFRINKKSIADSDATSLKISFRVTKSWLTENSLTSGDISLYRYKSGWNALTTRVTGTDGTYVNYEADTPGFSSFAVGVKSDVEVEEEVPGEVPEGVSEEEVAPPEAVEKPEPVEAPGKAPGAWLIAAVVVIIGIILIVLYQRRKNQG